MASNYKLYSYKPQILKVIVGLLSLKKQVSTVYNLEWNIHTYFQAYFVSS